MCSCLGRGKRDGPTNSFSVRRRYPISIIIIIVCRSIIFPLSRSFPLHYHLSHSLALFFRLSFLSSRQRSRFSFSLRPERDDKGQQNGGSRVFVIFVLVLPNAALRSNSTRHIIIARPSSVEPADTAVRRRYDCCRRVIGVINLLWPRVQGCRPPADYDDTLDESSYRISTRTRHSALRIAI
jgi:hypothetical protein